MSLVYRYYKL